VASVRIAASIYNLLGREIVMHFNFLYAVAAALLTVACWGVYGPVLHQGQQSMGAVVDGKPVPSRLRPLLCVGLAYFLIAVIVPVALLYTVGEQGQWTFGGTFWSLTAGAAGAIGALGIVMALSFGGSPVWVMPLVFGCAPVVSVFANKFLSGSTEAYKPWLLAALVLVSIGAVMTLVFAPKPGHGSKPSSVKAASAESAAAKSGG
jgi:hypothetical protein